ncbi:G-alpha-domain-containing protein [Cristinia sonorae]|uniref:G-alpha-domain-containing protein n=1 Tax=Cristinia sonorae TaxID=1940300 RepID=A0A8K0UIU9_9AGAR|nr:G-alpha-domain-containing protein [Cristinia sonorae]
MRFSSEMEDPISVLLRPPPNETLQEREVRLSIEAEAKRVSDQIDEGIKAERVAMRKRKECTKLLLLGQSESGKSTTLRNFQMTFAPKAWQAERASWRAVIQLNLVRAVNTILDTVVSEMSSITRPSSRPGPPGISPPSSSPPRASAPYLGDFNDDSDAGRTSEPQSPKLSSDSSSSATPTYFLQFTSHHSVLKLSLAPLRSVESDLKSFLGSGSEEINADVQNFTAATPFDTAPASPVPSKPRRVKEFTVQSMSAWKTSLGSKSRPTSPRTQSTELDSVTEVIAGCREDIRSLWQDGMVGELLKRRKIKLQDSAFYYLNNADRIARSGYEPSDDDVLRARLRTLGVQEHKLSFENSADFDYGSEWIIYDVGGARTSRWAWLPYFDDAHAILFLAPISCFDEQLAEDPRVNRLQDSFILWKSIVSSKLLANCAIILFMNKYDLLAKKIKSGAIVKNYTVSYGERENSPKEFARYLRHQFKSQLREFSPQSRAFYGFTTSVIDQKATATTLLYMRDCILRDHLKQADFV